MTRKMSSLAALLCGALVLSACANGNNGTSDSAADSAATATEGTASPDASATTGTESGTAGGGSTPAE